MINKISLILVCILLFSCNKNDNNQEGLHESRNSSGILEKIEFHKDNQIDGIYARFHENGRLYSFGIYKQDSLKNGPIMIFFKDGQLNTFDNYINNKKDGVSLHYNSMGILTRKSYYNNGFKDGYEYYFNFETGDTISTTYYRKGELISPLSHE